MERKELSKTTPSIEKSKKPDLEITSAHSEGTRTYTVNSDGEISF